MTQPWPEIPSALRPAETLRDVLDYLHWASQRMLGTGAHGGVQRDLWRDRIWRSYAALFIPPVLGFGDPYPPDVPPSQTPGIWPDIPAAGITGMTVRHQLTVIGMLAGGLRDSRFGNLRAADLAEWDRRLARAREALEQGPEHPVPAEARTRPSKEALEDLAAREKAIEEHARRRRRQIQRLLSPAARAARKASKPTVKKAAAKRAPARKAAGGSPKKPAAAKGGKGAKGRRPRR